MAGDPEANLPIKEDDSVDECNTRYILEVECILNILERTVQKLELAACVPIMIQQPDMVQDMLPEETQSFLLFCNRYYSGIPPKESGLKVLHERLIVLNEEIEKGPMVRAMDIEGEFVDPSELPDLSENGARRQTAASYKGLSELSKELLNKEEWSLNVNSSEADKQSLHVVYSDSEHNGKSKTKSVDFHRSVLEPSGKARSESVTASLSFLRTELDVGMVEFREEPNVCRLIYMLVNDEDVVDSIKDELLPLISPSANSLVHFVKVLKKWIETRLMETPKMIRERSKASSKLLKRSEEEKMEMENLEKELKDVQAKLKERLDNKNNEIRNEEALLERVRRKCKDDVKAISLESERNMVTEWKNSEFRLKGTKEDIKKVQHELETTLKSDLRSELEKRSKRFKVESELMALINKYDNDMGERQDELEKTEIEYAELEKELARMQEIFDEQEVEYKELMAEKLQYEQDELWQQVAAMRMNRAARLIQRYWRKYKFQKAERSKMKKAQAKKKGKKGKK